METRQVSEVKVYMLVLNNMRGNTEDTNVAAVSYDKEILIDWYKSQLAPEPYIDEDVPSFPCHGSSHKWSKVFKKESLLEWYNPCASLDTIDGYGVGMHSHWVEEFGLEERLSEYNIII